MANASPLAEVYVQGAGPLMDLEPLHRIRFAIDDPGAVCPRRSNFTEPLLSWQARAVMAVLQPELSDLADFEKSVPA